jgi:hypothetical protein
MVLHPLVPKRHGVAGSPSPALDRWSGRHVAGEPTRSRDAFRFLRHLGEMFIAMLAGMMVLGTGDRAILSAAGTSPSAVQDAAPELVSLVMAFNMTVGMTVWMRHRRHSWSRVTEMAGAMFIPAMVAIVLFWCAVIHKDAILSVQHLAMLPAMVGVMLLHRGEFSNPHGRFPASGTRADGGVESLDQAPTGRR